MASAIVVDVFLMPSNFEMGMIGMIDFNQIELHTCEWQDHQLSTFFLSKTSHEICS